MRRFSEKTVVVTGGGHGIGRASALRFSEEGARVAILDINAEAAVQTAKECRRYGVEAYGAGVDVSDTRQVSAAVQEVLATYDRIDVLHSNAGRLTAGTVLEVEPEEWDRTFAVNVRSTYLMARAVLPGMLAAGRGVIVNTGSISGLLGEPALAAYDASKGAVINFTRQLAAEYAGAGIRINCVCPGWIDTGFNDPEIDNDNLDDAAVNEIMHNTIPMRRQGTPEEIAGAVAFLASDDASYISGHALTVDGGLTACI
jgi:NAD(P)-dependent dehydrogenase (short-subunit alcohol dehydrogenase family)